MVHWHPVPVANQLLTLITTYLPYLYNDYNISYIVLRNYSLSKFGVLGTFAQLKQGHEIEKLHVMAGSKLLKKCFHKYSDNLLLILVGWSLGSIIGNIFQILGKRLK